MKLRIMILLVIFSAFLATTGCAPAALESNQAGPSVTPEAPTDVDNGDDDPMEPPTLSNGEVPQALFDAALADLLARTGGERADVEVIQAESVTWNDGSLGCPQPGVMYTQAIIEGYQVKFRLGGETYDYHMSERGNFVLCEGLR